MRRLLVGLLLLLPANAWALEWVTPFTDSVGIVETLKILHDQTDPDRPFWAVVNRLNLIVIKGPFIAGLRYDAEGYFLEEEYYLRYIPEKVFLQYSRGGLLVRLGDSYVRFGQGLTLSLLKRDEFGEDTTLQGALLRLSYETFELESLIGPVNPGDDRAFVPERAQMEEPDFIDERNLLWGVRLLAGHPDYVKVGGAWVGGTLRFDPESAYAQYEEDDRVNLFSVIVEAPNINRVGALEGEYAWLEYEDDRTMLADVNYEGRGAHLAMTWYVGPVTLLAEATDYYRFDFPYHDPPSMEYPDVAFGHLPNFADAVGARGRLDYTIPGAELDVYLNYTNLQTHAEIPLDLATHYRKPWQEWIEHTYGGFDRAFANGAMLSGSGGYREIVEGWWVHGKMDLETPLVRPHGLGLGYHVKQFHGFGAMRETEYASHEGVMSYNYSPYLTLSGSYEYSNEPASGTITPGEEEEDDPHFWSVETVVQPVDWLQVSLGYGRYKGGLKCAGGVCRQIPPFEGFQSEFAFRF